MIDCVLAGIIRGEDAREIASVIGKEMFEIAHAAYEVLFGVPHIAYTKARGGCGHELHEPLCPLAAPGTRVIGRFGGHHLTHELGIERIARGKPCDEVIQHPRDTPYSR